MNDRLYRGLSLACGILFVVWGAFTLLAYLGVPVHGYVLIDDVSYRQVAKLCPAGDGFLSRFVDTQRLCSGALSLLPMIGFLFTRLAPLWLFIVLSVLAYGVLLFSSALRIGRWRLEGMLRPWHLAVAFLAVLWLVFESASVGFGTDSNPMRVMYEPLPQVYVNANQRELDVLQENLDRLDAQGCLAHTGVTPHGAKTYRLREWCVQLSFVTRVLPPLIAVTALLLECLLLGSALLRVMRIDVPRLAVRALLSVGAGAGLLMAILWLIAELHLFTVTVGWVLAAIIPLVCYREVRAWWYAAKEASVHVDLPLWSGRTVLFWIFLAILALNFLSVVRPFPIGWDDLGRYLNQPRLLVSYGHAIPTMGTFQWEFLTSLGFLLFGYDSTFGAIVAMQINWAAGLLAALTVYMIARTLLGRGAGLLAALLYYATPVVQHFSFADMKTDNAVFAIGALALFAALLGMYPHMHQQEEDSEDAGTVDMRLLVLAGLLGGFAFGVKATSIMIVTVIGCLLFHRFWRGWGFVAAAFFTLALYVKQGTLDVMKVAENVYGDPSVYSKEYAFALFLVIALFFSAIGVMHHRGEAKRLALSVGVFVAGFLVAVLPWIVVNSVHAGDIIPRLRFTAPNTISANFELSPTRPVTDVGQPIRKLPPELQVDLSHPQCQGTAGSEELDRYWGYGSGWSHYLLLPWRAVLDLDSPGYYVTELPGFLLFPLVFLLPMLWTAHGKMLRALMLGTVFLVAQWMFLANGVPWYGVSMFLGLAIAMETLVRKAPSRTAHGAALVLAFLSVWVALGMRLWQLSQQKSLYEYPIGKVSAEVMRVRTVYHYDPVRDAVVQRAADHPSSPYVYRMGTFIPYFIPKNLELLPFADNQLDQFNCINQERNHALTLRRLQALGFNSMIFDLNTATIEKDPNGSLHKKVQALIDFLNDASLGIQTVVNDQEAGIAFVLLPLP